MVPLLFIAVVFLSLILLKSYWDGGKESTKDIDYVFRLIKLKDQYRAYGYEAEAKELDERIKELLKKIEL